MDLKDSSGVDVEEDIFDELLGSATVSFKAFVKNSGKNKSWHLHCLRHLQVFVWVKCTQTCLSKHSRSLYNMRSSVKAQYSGTKVNKEG